MPATTRWRCPRGRKPSSAVADRRLRESGGPTGGTTGGYIDSFENMPGAQNQPFGAKPAKAFIPEIGRRVVLDLDGHVDGLVCDVLPGPLPEAAIVVKLDRELHTTTATGRHVAGRWLVVEPTGTPSRWGLRGDSRVELWAEAPPSEPWLDREPGAFLAAGTAYRFGV